jgi:hypothetical protein
MNYYMLAPALYFSNVTIYPGQPAPACAPCPFRAIFSSQPHATTPTTPPPCTGGINVYGSNSSSACAVYDGYRAHDGYFPLKGNCSIYDGPPYLTSTTYSTFIGIAWYTRVWHVKRL